MDQFPISVLIGNIGAGIKDVDFYYDDINEGQDSHLRIIANVEIMSLDGKRE